MIEHIDWDFPLPRPHCGLLLGNARLGAMIWGGGDTLNITLGRADLWDHRGGMPWRDEHNFHTIRALLESGDEPGIRRLFHNPSQNQPGQPPRPSIISIGRIELRLPAGATLRGGRLVLAEGRLDITVDCPGGPRTLHLLMPMEEDVLLLQGSPELVQSLAVTERPAMELLTPSLQDLSFPDPQAVQTADAGGWWQPFPADPGVCVLHCCKEDTLLLSAVRAGTLCAAQEAAAALASRTASDRENWRTANARWWQAYWRDVPQLELPNPRLQLLYQYGMYKFAGLSQPGGVAATLQGPWVEDYQLPPWSNDYHFNINVQMCYWPAYRGNRLSHLRPLFDLVLSWEPLLIDVARKFAGVEDGRMLPHSVDDRCTPMGGFWTGMIDHACTAWVAQMMYDYAVFAPDEAFLRDKALPFMRGTFRVFAAMLEERDGRYHLPVSVSPEYGGCEMSAWGRNASFQLAAIHRLCRNLQAACGKLGLAPDPMWEHVDRTLPQASVFQAGNASRIGLWDGKDLEESHRHHSHLGGLYPFDTLDLTDPATQKLLNESVRHWVYKGMGLWSGWCVPWAAILHARLGNGAMPELLLEIWERVFTNEGRGTLHDCNFPGFTLMGARPPLAGANATAGCTMSQHEIMQMDAGMGATGALLELLVMQIGGVHYVFRGIPASWKDCAFRGIRTEGGFLLSGKRRNGRFEQLEIRATAAGTITLGNPLCSCALPGEAPQAGATVVLQQGNTTRRSTQAQWTLELAAGEVAILQA